jgi:hypothetical protein
MKVCTEMFIQLSPHVYSNGINLCTLINTADVYVTIFYDSDIRL